MKKYSMRSEKGFVHLGEILVLVLVIALIGGAGAYINSQSKAATVPVDMVATEDSYVTSSSPNTNYGTVNNLYTKSTGPVNITYLKFDLTQIKAESVESALLEIRITDTSPNVQNIHATSNDWAEKTINYNNKPALGDIITTFSNLPSGKATIDMTAFMKSNAGKIVSLAVESKGTDKFAFRPKEATTATNRPTLKVTLTTSPTPTPTPTPTPAPTPSPTDYTSPKQNTAWQWQLTGTINETVLDSSTNPNKMYDIDMFDASTATISRLKAKGIYVVCYVEAGDWAKGRPDAGDFAPSILGKTIGGFPDERFINVTALDSPAGPTGKTLRQIMTARLQLAKDKGCQGIEPDLDDLHTYSTGFTITQANQVAYNKFLIDTGHSMGMSVGLKNGPDEDTAGSFTTAMYNAGADWVLNEECNQYNECTGYNIFIRGGRPVFQVEYLDNQNKPYGGTSGTCAKNNTAGFDGIVKDSSSKLAALPRTACRTGN